MDESVVPGGVDQQDWSALAGCTDRQLADLIAANHAALMVHEARVLLLAASWADCHDIDTQGGDYQPLVERACEWGGDGTPPVSEYCAAELGTLQGTGMVAGRQVIADALDLRHRLLGCPTFSGLGCWTISGCVWVDPVAV